MFGLPGITNCDSDHVCSMEGNCVADAVIAWATRNAIDENRYLKLRRIALGNLSRVL